MSPLRIRVMMMPLLLSWLTVLGTCEAFEIQGSVPQTKEQGNRNGDECAAVRSEYEQTVQKLKKSLHEAESRIKELQNEIDAPANPAEAEVHRLQQEVEKLYRQEKRRHQRIQHQDADEKDNGPKEISIFCKDPPAVSIADLEDEQRDKDECMVLNVNAPELSSRLILYCDGHTTVPDWTPKSEGDDDYSDSSEDEASADEHH